MSRPRRPLGDVEPGIQSGQIAVTLADMGAQTIDQTMTVISAGHVNIILNSLRTTNVYFHTYLAGGQSYNVTPTEVTAPTVSAIFIHMRSDTLITGGISARVKGFIIQGG